MKKNKLGQFNKTALISALLIEITTGAQAATINVDGTTCTLNDAVIAANTDAVAGGCTAGSGADVLELTAASTFDLTIGTDDVISEVTVNGNGSTVQPDSGVAGFRLFTVQAGGNLTINNTTVANGVSENADRNFGGGVRSYDGQLQINDSTFTGHLGGAILFTRSTGGVNNTVVDNNTGYGSAAQYYGGGISIANSTVSISNSTISNNSTDSGLAGGGGLYVTNYGGSNVSISNTTFSGNTSTNPGGGIGHLAYGAGSTVMTLTNVTMVNNTSAATGGGLSNDAATITIAQSLVSGNSGTGGTEIDSSGGTVTVDDYNLFGFNSSSGVVGVTVGTSDLVPSEATLAEIIDINLANNGGPTPTHALVEGSPAIDAVFAVPAASCSSLTDQTGKARPIDGDADGLAVCDIGAFENENPDIIFKNGFD